jgi:hypothetical protein
LLSVLDERTVANVKQMVLSAGRADRHHAGLPAVARRWAWCRDHRRSFFTSGTDGILAQTAFTLGVLANPP